MINIYKINYKKNIFYSENQFNFHYNIYKNSFIKINNYLNKQNIIIKNKFELIDIISDISEPDKNFYKNILGDFINHDFFFRNINFSTNFMFGNTEQLIINTYNNYNNFLNNFIKIFLNHTGWGWLIINNNKLCLLKTKDNINPLFSVDNGGFNSYPIICLDLHEHSYLYDYKDKYYYLINFIKHINWFEIENRIQNYKLNL